jgi:ribosome-associated toxin RatA of RatAB toxin-antitoxin module
LSETPYSELDPDLSAQLDAVEMQTEQVVGRQRRITAQILIAHQPEQVWQVLSNYEALSEFIPNLAKSQLLEHPEGGIRLEQVGTQSLLRLNFSARVVLDLEEDFPEQIHFQMVEGDFQEFAGFWKLEPLPDSSSCQTNLHYSVLVWPPRAMPVKMIERTLCRDLSINLVAIRQRVAELFDSSNP